MTSRYPFRRLGRVSGGRNAKANLEVKIASFDRDDEKVRKTFEMASGQVEGCPDLELQAIKLFHDTLHLAPSTQYITHLQTTP